MAFDGSAPYAFQPSRPAPSLPPMVPIGEQGFPVRAGDVIALHDRLALTLGYAAFGLSIGAAASLVVGGLEPSVIAALVAVPAVAAVVIGRSCLRVLHWSALPLVALIVIAAGWAIAGATLPDRNADLMPAIGLFGAALLMTTVASCRAFPAALAVSMLGMALAAPVGAATVLSIFG